jgi:hypothetical protein
VRCARSREDGCRFFIWERDEPTEREQHLTAVAQQLPAPQTPHINRHRNVVATVPVISGLPTPSSGGGRMFTNNQTIILQPAGNVSPTPYRLHNNRMTSNDDNDDLIKRVFELLNTGGISLNRSMDVRLREIINSTTFAYEARIQTLETVVKDLERHLQEMEGNGS